VALTKKLLTELGKIAETAPPHNIVRGKNYLYFSLAPTQEAISTKEICNKPNLKCYAVRNFKNSTIGYLALLGKKPDNMTLNEFGVALYFSKVGKGKDLKKANLQYRKPNVTFSDAKFRVLSFDNKDYFCSVKWRSNNPVGE
jgi:hypothetical protein